MLIVEDLHYLVVLGRPAAPTRYYRHDAETCFIPNPNGTRRAPLVDSWEDSVVRRSNEDKPEASTISFEFGGVDVAAFSCRLDSEQIPCSSPELTLDRLRRGNHALVITPTELSSGLPQLPGERLRSKTVVFIVEQLFALSRQSSGAIALQQPQVRAVRIYKTGKYNLTTRVSAASSSLNEQLITCHRTSNS